MPCWDGFAALDWSGAAGPRQRGIAVATCGPGTDAPTLVRSGHVWSREEALAWVLERAGSGAWLIGFDLSPALPFADRGAYFPGWPDTPDDARGLWRLVERLCADELHLGASGFADHPEASRHFRRHGGRTGDLFEAGRGRLRVVERAQLGEPHGLSPSSCFNLVGAAQVGKSSLTGMRVYHRLDGRVPMWPFDPKPDSGSAVVEIYTRSPSAPQASWSAAAKSATAPPWTGCSRRSAARLPRSCPATTTTPRTP